MPQRRTRPGSPLTALEQRVPDLQRWLVCAVLVVAPLVFWRGAMDAFGVAKAFTVVLIAVVATTLWCATTLRTGRLDVPKHRAVVALAIFLGLAALATGTSDAVSLSVAGHYPRFSGLVMYVAFAGLFLVTIQFVELSRVRTVLLGALAGGCAVALYAVVQWMGLDPVTWEGPFVGAASTVGNPNYAGAHVAIVSPLALWVAVDRRRPPALRVVGVGLLVVGLLGLVAARAVQGFVAAGAGLAVFSLAWVRGHLSRARRLATGAWVVGVAAGVAVFLAGVAARGPLAFIAARRSFRMRSHDWVAAWNMFRENALLGVGFDRYGAFYNAYRAPEATFLQSLDVTTSTPHSVPINMFVSGGVPLGVAYLVFVAIVVWSLVHGLYRLEGRRLLLAGAAGAAWVAYQTQAFVSVDVPSLGVTGWVLGALVLVVTDDPGRWSLWLPWAKPTPGRGAERTRKGEFLRSVRIRRVGRAGTLAAGVIALIILWWPWTVLMADVRAGEAQRSLADGDVDTAVSAALDAYRRATWQPDYGTLLTRAHLAAGDEAAALDALEDALDRDPRDLGSAVNAARVANRTSDLERAVGWYERALTLEPNDPDLAVEAAGFFIDVGHHATAVELLDRALALRPNEVDWWVRLGFAHHQMGQAGTARHAYERALELDPDHEGARRLKGTLHGDGG